MKAAWKIGTFSGIDVFIHATFILIIGWVGLSYWQQTQTLAGTLEGILFTLILFSFVVFHEFGHALTARRYGIKTRDITLYPIGGVARLERMPEKPVQEFWVALAGPAVNVVIAAVLFIWLLITGGLTPLSSLSLTTGPFVERLMLVNVWLVLFNMIPAFPMDGGRVLRALLAMRMDYTRATQVSRCDRTDPGFGFWFYWALLQSIPCLHRLFRLDWRTARGFIGADEIGFRRHPGLQSHDHRFSFPPTG